MRTLVWEALPQHCITSPPMVSHRIQMFKTQALRHISKAIALATRLNIPESLDLALPPKPLSKVRPVMSMGVVWGTLVYSLIQLARITVADGAAGVALENQAPIRIRITMYLPFILELMEMLLRSQPVTFQNSGKQQATSDSAWWVKRNNQFTSKTIHRLWNHSILLSRPQLQPHLPTTINFHLF